MALTDDDVKKIVEGVQGADQSRLREVVRETVSEELDGRRTIPIEEHRDHHLWIGDQIRRHRVRGERFEAVRRQVVGWAVIAFLGGIGLMSYEWVVAAIRKIAGSGNGG